MAETDEERNPLETFSFKDSARQQKLTGSQIKNNHAEKTSEMTFNNMGENTPSLSQ